MNRQIVAAASLLCLSTAASAGGLAFRISDDSFGLSLASDISPQSSLQFDALHQDDDATLLAAGVYANGQRGSLMGRVGAKLIGVEGGDSGFDGGTLALGGDVRLPLNDVLFWRAGVYVGPESASFDDVEGYVEWSTSLEINIFQNSAIQLGYGSMEFDAEGGGEFEFDDGAFIRLQLRL